MRVVVWTCHAPQKARRHCVCHQTSTLSPVARGAVSSSRVRHHDPKWMAKDLASVEFASAADENVLCSVINVNECAETTNCVDLLATVCDDYPRFAEWSNHYLGDRRIQFHTVVGEERDSLFGLGGVIEQIWQISKYSACADSLVRDAR
jgi:hypothetical protein